MFQSLREDLQWHVHNGGDSACCGSLCGCCKPLPVCPSRLINMDMAINNSGHHSEITGI